VKRLQSLPRERRAEPRVKRVAAEARDTPV
jgi:hypothetical protein